MTQALPFVSNSQRKTFRRCQQQWYWAYVERLAGKGKPADALWFGTGIHHALADWYRPGFTRGDHPADTFADWCDDEVRTIKAATEDWHDEPLYVDAANLGFSMLEAYVDEYGNDPDVEMLAVEQPFEIEIWGEDEEPIAIFRGIFDGVYRDHADGQAYLWEHKSAAKIATAFLALDDQAGSYYAVASIVLRAQGILGPGESIAGITYNYLRKTAPDERPRDEGGAYLNKDGTVSKKQPAKAFVREIVERTPQETQSQMRRMAAEVTVMNGIRDGKPPIKSTTQDCPYCPFFELCVLDERGATRAAKEFKRATYTIKEQGQWENVMKSASE